MSILNDAYLKEQLITYIGNKRRLLPLIFEALKSTPGIQNTFLDLFSGSGVVSRLGRVMGFHVIANDWEEYSRILGESHLKLNVSDIDRLFGSPSTLRDLLYDLNNLPEPAEEDCYMSRYYAPSDTDIYKADFKRERLFYTRENALRIDGIRNFIEKEFPAGSSEQIMSVRNLLIGLLLCESSKHTNTSGVFKAYHKGFGGHGQDALNRITGLVKLPYPILPENCRKADVYCRDANELVLEKSLPGADVAYLDPPYNQHQYGSNYHILNTIALWDKIPAPLELNEKGVLKEKAAIRKDWIKTKSPYCYKKSAGQAFSELMQNLDARKILISYSNDGLIPFEKMMEICESRGNISIISNEYTKFRGGRQSNSRLHSNIEFVLVVDTEKKKSASSRRRIRKLILLREIALFGKKVVSRQKLKEIGGVVESTGSMVVEIDERKVEFKIRNGLYLELESDISSWPERRLEKLRKILSLCTCSTRSEELEEIFSLIHSDTAAPSDRLLKEVPRRIRMIAHKKTKDEYVRMLDEYEQLRLNKRTLSIDRLMDEIKIQAEKRFRE